MVSALPPAGTTPQTTISAPKGVYRVVDTATEGRRMYYISETGETIDRGTVLAADDALNSVGQRDEVNRSWDVPESYALKFERGNPGLAEHVIKSYTGAEAGLHRGLVGYLAVTKKMPYDEALAKTEPELVRAQLADLPSAAWGDDRLQKVVGASKWALGSVAEILPSITGSAEAGAKALPMTALTATGVAALGGPAGLAALATPAGVAGVMGVAFKYGAFDFTSKVTTGSMALDMRAKGIDESTIETVAPLAGMFAGALEVLHVKYLPAPFRRAVVSRLFNNAAVKKAMSSWAMNYFKETGAEVSVEVAQQYIENFAGNMMAAIDDRPDLAKSMETMNSEALKVAAKTAVGLGILKAPGAMVEARMAATPAKEGASAAAPAPAAKAEVIEAAAPGIEEEIVTSVPEVADTLAALNKELNPASPNAAVEYREMGKELAGRAEEVNAAVEVKREALLAEQADIFAEAEDAPLSTEQQNRVAAIQNEMSLLDELRSGMAEKPAAPSVPAVAAATPVTGVQKRVQAAVIKAREARLETELDNTLEMVKELERSRERLQKAGRTTKTLDTQITKLMQDVFRMDEERAKLAEGQMPARGAELEMKAATLESITKTAFTQGRKEVVTRRAGMLKDVAAELSLTDRDIKLLAKNRNLGVMSDFDFKKFVDDFRTKAKALADRKQARAELEATKQAKELKREDNIRRVNNLPPVAKMTAAQMRQYAEILEGYETGDEFWTPKRIEALKNTRWTGAETVREVIEKAARELGVTPEDLKAVKVSEFDRFRYDTALARQNPIYNFMVDEVKTAEIKNAATYFEVREEMFKLAAAAEASRPRTLGEKVVPTQEAVMDYIEAEDAKARAAIAAGMTKEELALAEYIQKVYADAYAYLLAGKDLSGSRFADGRYVFHSRRPISEILSTIKETGVKEAVTEILGRWQQDETRFSVTEERTGEVLGLRKFFRQTLFRSGELRPSKNVVRSTDVYLRQFFKKKALDEAVPSVETLVMALAAADRTEQGKQMAGALQSFVKTYLNAKKGQVAIGPIVQGGKIDAAIRFMTNLVSLQMIALNIPLQIASVVGETVAKVPALGGAKLLLAQKRKLSKQGRAILAKYKFFTGEGVLEEVLKPGQTVEERAGLLIYGLFKWSRQNTMADLLLGNMTAEEFAAGEISAARLAQIKKQAGRWLDVGNMRSVVGSTSTGAAFTQFKSWAVPIMSSTIDDAKALLRTITKSGKPLTAEQTAEIYRIAEVTAVVAAVYALSGEADEDDDSFLGRTKFYAYRELTTLLQALSLPRFLATPASMAWLQRLANNLEMLYTLEKDAKTGELKGWRGLKKQLTPSMVRQMLPSEKKGPKKLMEGGR